MPEAFNRDELCVSGYRVLGFMLIRLPQFLLLICFRVSFFFFFFCSS